MVSGSDLHRAAQELAAQGRRAEALSLYAQALAADPANAELNHLAGLTAYESGLHDQALAWIGAAVGLHPQAVEYRNSLGVVLQDAGRFDEAAAVYAQAVAQRPDYAEAHSNLGIVRVRQGRIPEAEGAFREAIRAKPTFAEAHFNLGNVLREQDRTEEAAQAFARALELKPDYAEALTNLGDSLVVLNRPADAIPFLERALRQRPDSPEARICLGVAMEQTGQSDRAVELYEDALRLRPNLAEAHNNIGIAHQGRNEIDAAIAAYDRALAADPDFLEAKLHRGMARLVAGRFWEGWRDYECRWETRPFRGQARSFSQPLWDGSPLQGRRLLIWGEQGLGDNIQFVRYLPRLAGYGGTVILEVDSHLIGVLSGVAGVDELVMRDDSKPLPPFDCHLPLLSLPLHLGPVPGSWPDEVPYLPAAGRGHGAMVETIRALPGLKVALTWAGRPEHKHDHRRSVPLAALAPLAEVPGVSFVSVQKGAGADQRPPPGLSLHVPGPLNDFNETAAVLKAVDLLISVDTSVAHLAGALGRPTWLLLAAAPDWRWLLDREDSPWYPTLRLFRQEGTAGWAPVIRRVRRALAEAALLYGAP